MKVLLIIAILIGVMLSLTTDISVYEDEAQFHIWQCEILALELELSRVDWEDAPKRVGYNLKSPEATDYFNAYNAFNIECTDVH